MSQKPAPYGLRQAWPFLVIGGALMVLIVWFFDWLGSVV